MFVKSPDGTERFIVYHTHFKPERGQSTSIRKGKGVSL